MRLIEHDYWWKTLILDYPAEASDLTARVRVRQPQGYVQELTVEDVELRDGQAHVPILYPLVDEGRYDAKPGMWEGAWLMGAYRFDVELIGQREGGRRRGADPRSAQLLPVRPHGDLG